MHINSSLEHRCRIDGVSESHLHKLCLSQVWMFSILFCQSVFCMLTAWWVSYLQSASNCIGDEVTHRIGSLPPRFTFSWTAPALGTMHQLNDHVQSYLFGKCSALLVLQVYRPAQNICNLHGMEGEQGR